MTDRRYIEFLSARDAGQSAHGTRNLLEHLLGTHALLTKWRAAEPVRLAGLFHSVYGTSIYRHRSVPLAERTAVAGLIGAAAERLAYLYCMASRPRLWLGRFNPLFPRIATVSGTRAPVSRRELAQLVEIECANLIEQPGGGAWFEGPARLASGLRGMLSPGCARALDRRRLRR